MFTEDYSNNIAALHIASRGALVADAGADYIETTTSSLPPNKLINIKQLILDKSSNSLEIVLEALKTQNTDCIANSTILGTMLTYNDLAVFARIIASIGINYVESNFAILAFTLEIEKQRLQECERNRLY